MRLVIAEKPSLAKQIAEAISKNYVRDTGEYRCEDSHNTVVTWLRGHVLEPLKPDGYCVEWAKWDFATLPMFPSEWRLEPKADAKEIIKNVHRLLKEADEVVHAGDPDNEGQLLVDELLEFCGWNGKTHRLLLKDLRPEAIQKAFGEMRDNSEFKGLRDAALSRQIADWYIGMNASRYFTLTAQTVGYEGKISIGRVQTPTLGLVVRRDIEIENFKPIPYYNVYAKADLKNFQNDTQVRTLVGTWQPKEKSDGFDNEGRLIDRNIAETILEKVKGKPLQVTKYEKDEKSEAAPLPYRLADLQAEANKRFGFTLKKTLDVVQSLYEKQTVSYPRSDCQYLPESHLTEVPKIIETVLTEFSQYVSITNGKIDSSRKSRAFDDRKVTEHYAITPTGKSPSSLTDDESKIYELICVRYLVQFMPDHQYRAVTAEFECEGETFQTKGRELVNIGWRALAITAAKRNDKESDDEGDGEDENSSEIISFIVPVTVGESGTVIEGNIQDKKTTSPKYFTDGSLVKAMSNIHVYVSDPELKKTLREVDGIGTSATQYQIVEKLITNGFMRREKKEIRSTETGRVLIQTLEAGIGKPLTFPDMTAEWERDMRQIERREVDLDSFISKVAKKVEALCHSPVDGSPFECLGTPIKKAKCPICGGSASQRKGKYGLYWRCSSCNEILKDVNGVPVAKEKFERKLGKCPECGKQTVLLNGKNGKFWKCENHKKCGKTFSEGKCS